ncbi:MAG: Lytic transglycosylase catalytic [Hyphomicrobiales bacterium]|nr:Lytic transglycosylase catalytic [Hyphomicrobiales bacterium]
MTRLGLDLPQRDERFVTGLAAFDKIREAMTRIRLQGALLAGAVLLVASTDVRAQAGQESLREALCRLVETSAARENLPVGFFTKLIFKESAFRPHVVSPAGAQGVAQFMPGTAAERGLANPFDPEQAIPASARLLSDLRDRFGNLGLAAAAYNGGPARVAAYTEKRGGLPAETRDYVASITGAPAEDWAAGKSDEDLAHERDARCLTIVVALGRNGFDRNVGSLVAAALAPWGVQLAANFNRGQALAAFRRNLSSVASAIGEQQPMIIGTRFRSRGSRPFYRVRVPAPTRLAANQICDRIRAKGGACAVLKT